MCSPSRCVAARVHGIILAEVVLHTLQGKTGASPSGVANGTGAANSAGEDGIEMSKLAQPK